MLLLWKIYFIYEVDKVDNDKSTNKYYFRKIMLCVYKKIPKVLYFVMYLSLKITSVLVHYIINWIDFDDNETYIVIFIIFI